MFDITFTASNIADWPSQLGITLPKKLSELCAVFDEAGYAEWQEPVIDADTMTTANVGELVRDLAEDLARQDKHAEARRRVRFQLARRVVGAAGDAVPEIVNKLRPGFTAAAESYVAAVSKLPEELTAQRIVAGGDPEVLAALGQAKESVVLLNATSAWLAGLVNLARYAGDVPNEAVRLFSPSSPGELRALWSSPRNPDPLVTELGGSVFVNAARMGLDWTINTPDESRRIKAEIDQVAAAETRKRPTGVAYAR